MVRLPTRKPASPPKDTPERITSAATGLKPGTMKKAALPATPRAESTAITMISRAFGLRPSNIIKKGSIAAITTIRLHRRYLRPLHIFTEKKRSNGTRISMSPKANQVRELTFPFRSSCCMIRPSEGRAYSFSSSSGEILFFRIFLLLDMFSVFSETGSEEFSSEKKSSRN